MTAFTALVRDHGLASLDIESTSVDVEDARTVEICLARCHPGQAPDVRRALIDPGVEMPEGAFAVHGLSTEKLRAEGGKPAEVLDLYLTDIAEAARAGLPLVVMHAPYDVTVLDREARRHGLPTLHERLDGHPLHVLDPMVLDKRAIKFRRRVSPTQGARCLKTLAQVHGVPWDDDEAHGAVYDALIAARVVWRIAQRCTWATTDLQLKYDLRYGSDAGPFRQLAGMSLADLHARQIGWYAEQTESYAQYLRRESQERRRESARFLDDGNPEQSAIAGQEAAELDARIDGMDGAWPLKPTNVTEEAISA